MKTSPNSTADAAAAPSGISARGVAKWLLRLVLGVAIVAWLVSRPEGARVGSILRGASPWLLPIAAGAYLLGQAASARRWQLLLNASLPARSSPNTPLRFGECARIYLLGMFGNLWLPTSIGGDAARAFLAGRRIENFGMAATTVFLDRLIGLGGLVCAGALALFWDALAQSSRAQSTSGDMVPTPAWRVLLIASVGLILAGAVGVIFLQRIRRTSLAPNETGQARGIWSRIIGKLDELQEVLAGYAAPQGCKVLWAAFGWSIGVQIIQIVINIGLARAVGLAVPISTLAWLSPLLALSSVLPLGIGGLGVREAAAVALLHNSGAPQSTIIAWSLIWQATVWLSSLPGGLLMLNPKSRDKVL